MNEGWMQIFTLIGVVIALFGGLATIIIWLVNKLDSDIKSIGTRMDAFATRMDGHATRIDQLYKMFVDLLKDRK